MNETDRATAGLPNEVLSAGLRMPDSADPDLAARVTVGAAVRPPRAEGANLLAIGPELRDGVLVTRTAENRMRSDPAYLRELAAWTNPSSVGRHDGPLGPWR